MKVKSEDILKPGAVLKVEKIDWNDPEVKELLADHHRECDKLKKLSRWTQRKHDLMRQVITL